MALNKFNGWQRLWMLFTILWLAPVGFFAFQQWPVSYGDRVAGCSIPNEWFSLTAPVIINDELISWRRELPQNLVLNSEDQLKSPPKLTPPTPRREFLSNFEVFGYLPGFPEWQGDPLGRPEWAKAPWVTAYCKTLIERLERSGRAEQLHDANANAMQMPRIKWLALVFSAWIGPVVGVYLLGLAIFWVVRGFRKQP